MEVHAIAKNVPMSPQKMREVVRQIQGLPGAAGAGGARGGAAQRRAFRGQDAEVGHRQRRRTTTSLKPETLLVKEAVAGSAMIIKRFTPKARGSAGPILKRRCHIKITLSDE